MKISSETLLRRALAANAGFSALTGPICWIAAANSRTGSAPVAEAA